MGSFKGGDRCRSFVQIQTNWQLVKYVYDLAKIVYEFVRISHLVKYVRIAMRSGCHTRKTIDMKAKSKYCWYKQMDKQERQQQI